MSKGKVNLDTVKRLIKELELTLVSAESYDSSEAEDKIEYVVEMNKATGLAAGVMTEAALLMGDIQFLLKGADMPAGKTDMLEKILGPLKGSGNIN